MDESSDVLFSPPPHVIFQIHGVGVTPSRAGPINHPLLDAVRADSGLLLLSLRKDKFDEAFDGTTASNSAGPLLFDCTAAPLLVEGRVRRDDIILSRLLCERGLEALLLEELSSDSSYGGRRVSPFTVMAMLALLYNDGSPWASFGGTGGGRRFLRHRRKKNRPIMLTMRIPAIAEPMAMPIAAPVLRPSVLVSGCWLLLLPPGGDVWIGTENVATVVRDSGSLDGVVERDVADEVCPGTLRIWGELLSLARNLTCILCAANNPSDSVNTP